MILPICYMVVKRETREKGNTKSKERSNNIVYFLTYWGKVNPAFTDRSGSMSHSPICLLLWSGSNIHTCETINLFQQQENKQPNKKWAKSLKEASPKKIELANKPMKICSTLYAIREMQIKTTRHYYVSRRMVKI